MREQYKLIESATYRICKTISAVKHEAFLQTQRTNNNNNNNNNNNGLYLSVKCI